MCDSSQVESERVIEKENRLVRVALNDACSSSLARAKLGNTTASWRQRERHVVWRWPVAVACGGGLASSVGHVTLSHPLDVRLGWALPQDAAL